MKEITEQTTLKEIGFYGRLLNAMGRNNIVTVGDLLTIINADPMNWGMEFRNFGIESRLEIYGLLVVHGILKANLHA